MHEPPTAPSHPTVLPQAADEFDLIVTGAGINGAAIAREAALSGLKVLLIDQADTGSGTSATSSRLIHGGLRYLEHAELGLVRESLLERERLLRLAPHLIEPLALHIPVYRRSRRPLWQVRAGLTLYDLLTLGAGRSLPRHRRLSHEEIAERLPGLETAGLTGAVSYYDARVNWPERLVLENVHDAVDHGAQLLTYTRVTGFEVESDSIRGVQWLTSAGERGRASAGLVVNAAGPWVDRVLGPLGDHPLIGGTRGTHLIVAPFPGAPRVAVYAEAASDGRPFFTIPWNGLYLIGTTDERFSGDPSDCDPTEEEIDYLTAAAGSLFPEVNLADYVLYAHAGVRPLPHTESGATGAITRRHLIVAHPHVHGLYSIVGGKLTTHRALAEQALRTFARAGLIAAVHAPKVSPTRDTPLPGSLSPAARDALVGELTDRLGRRTAERLWHIYGGAARDLLTAVLHDPQLAEPFCTRSGAIIAELLHALEYEWATTLADVIRRRCMVGWNDDFGLQGAESAAAQLRRLGVWDRARAESELEGYRELARRARVRLRPQVLSVR